eukprot:1437_1
MAIPSVLRRKSPPRCPSIPNGMDTQSTKQLFKTWFKEKKYVQCKQLLLNMIGNGNDDYKLFSKLADICIMIGEYQNAEQYYIQSIDKNAHDASTYAKYGNLLHQHLNNDTKAQIMYLRSIGIDPNNDNCWFNYGKLLFKMGKYSQAEQCYKACVTERACIDYHYALLLLAYKPQETSQIKFLFGKATQIQPNVVQYHYKYAQYLSTVNMHNEANHEYHKAAVLSNYGDVLVLFDFAKFTFEHLKKYDDAKRLLESALKLGDAKKYAQVEAYYVQMMRNWNESISVSEQKQIVYEYSDEGGHDAYNEYDEGMHGDDRRSNSNNYVYNDYSDNEEHVQYKPKGGKSKGKSVLRWRRKPNGSKILDNLPVRLINRKEAKKEMDCRICMERFEFGDKVKTLPCFHWQFHAVCIGKWLKNNKCCPICLHVVTKVE